jgi:hypothetical protein
MKRLRELDPETSSALEQRAKAMLDAIEPLPESHERMLRIRRELDRPRGALPLVQRLPALAVGALVVLFGASAFAAARFYVARRAPAVAPATAQSPRAAPQRVRVAKLQRLTTQPQAEPAAPEPVPVVASPPANPPPLPGQAPMPTGASPKAISLGTASRGATAPSEAHRVRTSAPPRAPAQQTAANDSELVHRAVKALRVDHDPALAARLLDEHRARSPAGPLAEEALSLQIEAAAALGDGRAQAFAREYLARYPHGRYAQVAERALRKASP